MNTSDTIMKLQNIEQKITRTGVISLAALSIIGIIACFTGAFDIDMSIFSCTLIEDVFFFILGVLSILIGFCFPVSFMINISKLAYCINNGYTIKVTTKKRDVAAHAGMPH